MKLEFDEHGAYQFRIYKGNYRVGVLALCDEIGWVLESDVAAPYLTTNELEQIIEKLKGLNKQVS